MLDLTAARVVIQTIILEIFCKNEEKSGDNDNGGENGINIFTFLYSLGFLSDYQLRLWIAKGFGRAASVNRQMNFSFLLLPLPPPYHTSTAHRIILDVVVNFILHFLTCYGITFIATYVDINERTKL